MKTLSARLKRRRVLFVTILVLLPLFASVFGSRPGTAQAPPKEERELGEHVPKHLPIKVKVKKEEKLKDSENDDWLRDVEVEVTNIGDKPIYFILILIDVPNAFDDGRGTVYHLYYGRPELIAFEERARPDDVPLMPGESITLGVADLKNEMASWKHFRAKGRFKNPKKLYFKFQEINFGDGTGFISSAGTPIPEKREEVLMDNAGMGMKWSRSRPHLIPLHATSLT